MFSVACKNIVLSFLLVGFLFPESRTEYHAEKKENETYEELQKKKLEWN